MYEALNRGLHSRNGLVRKGSAFLLRGVKKYHQRASSRQALQANAPVMANSFPKSGTHLLDQVVEGLPGRKNYGAFLASMTSSFRFRERTLQSSCGILQNTVPGEIIRAHLFYHDQVAEIIEAQNIVHYFIYRDPRDVVLSESHYIRSINRWHKLHPSFRNADSLETAIMMSIRGLDELAPRIVYPDIARRFESYAGWLDSPNVCVLKFEDMISEDREQHLRRMIKFYNERSTAEIDSDAVLKSMIENMVPERSHTFRAGKAKGWQQNFTSEHRQAFKDLCGDLLIRLGYEQDHDW